MTTIPPTALKPGFEGGRGLDASDVERIASIRQRIATTSPFSALFSDLAWLIKLADRLMGAADAALKAAEVAHRDAAEDRARAAAEIVTLRTERDEARAGLLEVLDRAWLYRCEDYEPWPDGEGDRSAADVTAEHVYTLLREAIVEHAKGAPE